MHKLLFGNPVFEPTLSTCRSGEKWYDALSVGECFEICNIANEFLGKIGKVVSVDLVTWEDSEMDSEHIHDNHDVSCRTPTGLRAGMDEAYPNGWDVTALTIIRFVLV